jgi:hypothetical protein
MTAPTPCVIPPVNRQMCCCGSCRHSRCNAASNWCKYCTGGSTGLACPKHTLFIRFKSRLMAGQGREVTALPWRYAITALERCGLSLQGLKIALARHPGLLFLTAGLPSFVTRKTRWTSEYEIYRPINFTYIGEMMTFLRKSKIPMINIAIIITITNQNRFLPWSELFIFATIHYLDQGISELSILLQPVQFPILQSRLVELDLI